MNSPKKHPKKASAKFMLPVLALAFIGIGLGFYTSLQLAERNTSSGEASADENLSAVQDALQNTTVLPSTFKTVPEFSLISSKNEAITETVFDGQWSVVFFGYTHCPDVCPITLSVMNTVVNTMLEQQKTPPQVVFVSVDPVRDTAEKLQNYVNYFNDSFIGISGELTDITKLINTLGVVASYTASEDDPDNYRVDHTAALFLIDPQRKIRAKFNQPHEVQTILSDYDTLMNALQ